MKQRPILFSAPMVRALLAGTKTQTRRIITDAPEAATKLRYDRGYLQSFLGDEMGIPESNDDAWMAVVGEHGCETMVRCPYGRDGDQLWVRETFVLEDPCEYWYDDPRRNLPPDRPWKMLESDAWGNRPLIPHYRATEPEPNIVSEDVEPGPDCDRTRWKPSIFMPRWASRILLDITDVRVQRLQEISNEDARAEGVDLVPGLGGDCAPRAYFRLWDRINGNLASELNPWVWALTFKRITP